MERMFILVFAAVMLCNGAASAQEEQEEVKEEEEDLYQKVFVMADFDAMFRGEDVSHDISGTLTVPFTSKSYAGILVYGRAAREGAKAYIGPALLIGPFSFGAGIGLETDEDLWRAGAIAMLEVEGFTAHGIVDNGGSGMWWSAEALIHPRPWIGFGGMLDQNEGFGPRVEIVPFGKILSFHTGFMKHKWSEPGYTSMIGLRLQTDR